MDIMEPFEGYQVKNLHDTNRYEIGWEGENNYGRSVASGIYFYRLVTSTGVDETRKLIIMR
jgi:hypothetical protein